MENNMEKALHQYAKRSLATETWIRFKSNRMAVVGLIVIILLILISLSTLVIDFVTDKQIYDDYVIKQNLPEKLSKPSTEHIFGCDEYGRDILLRILWGTRYSLFSGLLAVLFSVVIGGLLGATAGYYGGKVDNVIMRIMDVFLAVPNMVLAIAIVSVLGSSLFNILISIAIPYVPRYARVVRGSVMTVRDKEYIEAARAAGASNATIIVKYLIPNSLSPIIVQASLGVATAILHISGLSFLGIGIQPPTPEWGSILSSARNYMRDGWHISVIPGLMIVITILALNLLGDGLRDALDPKLTK